MSAMPPPSGPEAASYETGDAGSNRYASGRRMTPQSPNEALQPEAAPPPPPLPPSRKRRRLSALSGFFSFVLIAGVVVLLGVMWGDHRLREPGPLASDKVVFIQKGSTDEIVEKLVEEGVVDSPFTVRASLLLKMLKGDKESLKSGEYLFRQQASVEDVITTLASGKQILHAITIPEGLTTQQVMQRLHEADVLTGEVKDMPKEGVILPETYKVSRGTSRAELLSKMKVDQRKAVEQIWARRSPDLPLRSPYELVTLASIVEKETGKADERPRIAGVFINRLRKRMRLQSDPTIVYGLVGGQGTLGHAISRAELDKPTPYNTYTIDGLPPGPIDNPGRAALEAVANPSRTADLYFVADGTGGHVFAETVDQHNRNVLRWRQIERDAKDKGTPDVDKLSPSALPTAPAPAGAAKPNQRSDAGGSVFGDLPNRFDASGRALRTAFFLDPGTVHTVEGMAAAEAVAPAAPSPGVAAAGRGPDRAMALAMTPGLDALGITVQGAKSSASDLLDGPVSAVGDDPAPGGDGSMRTASAVPPEHPRIFDASEGTAFDPLRDKSYDLNSAKAVPDMTKLPR